MPDAKRAEHIEQRRKAISEAFHSFHQPLTSLHCGLEIALLKPRTEEDYRKRIQEALASAGMAFELNKALRELVDAEDPGERFGTVAFAPLFAQVLDEVLSVAAAAEVQVKAAECPNVYICADPMKLLRMLGNYLAAKANELEAGGEVAIKFRVEEGELAIVIATSGTTKPIAESAASAQKCREIRLDAVRNYVETIGGELNDNIVKLPIA